eukprot:scaffold273927_cov30-Tisochrysis_lutea.AAC.2
MPGYVRTMRRRRQLAHDRTLGQSARKVLSVCDTGWHTLAPMSRPCNEYARGPNRESRSVITPLLLSLLSEDGSYIIFVTFYAWALYSQYCAAGGPPPPPFLKRFQRSSVIRSSECRSDSDDERTEELDELVENFWRGRGSERCPKDVQVNQINKHRT